MLHEKQTVKARKAAKKYPLRCIMCFFLAVKLPIVLRNRKKAYLRVESEKHMEETSGMPERKRIEVVAAVIRKGDRIFATQRGYGDFKDWWEFPGGKIEPGETPEEALLREIREELSAEIRIGRLLKTVEWDYPAFHLTLHCFLCTPVSDLSRP